jgi:copper chaperone CopZ
MKNLLYLFVFALFTFSAQAQTKPGKNAKHEFHVSGNCEMCKNRIEKAALSVSGVKSANWHLDCGTLYLILNENKTSVASVQAKVVEVGHDTDSLKATKESYDKLHSCCQYTRH